MKTLKELFLKKSTKGELVAVLEMVHNAHGSVSVSAMASVCSLALAQFKKDILPALLKEGALVIYNAKFRKKSPDVVIDLFNKYRIKHTLDSNIKERAVTVALGEQKDHTEITTIQSFIKHIPKAKAFVELMLSSTSAVTGTNLRGVLGVEKVYAKNILIPKMLDLKLLKQYHNNSYKRGDLAEICKLLGLSQQEESIKSHKNTLVPWDWFVDDINRLRVVLKIVSMDANGRHIDSVKAAAIAGELGVSKSEFVASYAPTLIAREALAHIGKNYTRGARFKEYVSIITTEADNELPTIGKYKPTKLTAEQKRRSQENTKASIKTMEKRRKNALASAKEWRDSEMFTKKEYEMRVDEINSEYDALIKNLSNTATKGA